MEHSIDARHRLGLRARRTASLWVTLGVVALALLVAVSVVLVSTDGLAGRRTDQATQPVGKAAERSPGEIRDFWTEERIQAAEPVPWPSVDRGGSREEGVFITALLVATVGAFIAVWLAFRPLDSTAWGTEIGLLRLLLLVVTLPIAVVVIVFRRLRQSVLSTG